jgi:hypothetical protein
MLMKVKKKTQDVLCGTNDLLSGPVKPQGRTNKIDLIKKSCHK